MSGFEVTGVVLGALPLIMKAIGNYENIIGPMISYRKFSSVLQTFMTELNVQRDIFQNECVWILSRFVDGHELEDMLKDPAHDLRSQLLNNETLQLKVAELIGPYAGQLHGILLLINQSLNGIYEEVKDLPDGLARPSTDETVSVELKAWRSQVRQKFKLSLRKDSLNQKVSDLRHRNQAFLALSQQIIRFKASYTPTEDSKEIESTERTLQKLQKLRSASQTLYQHMKKLSRCSVHAEHYPNLRLCLKTSEVYLDAPPKLSFEMALTYWDFEEPRSGDRQPILLAVESSVKVATSSRGGAKSTVRFQDDPIDDPNFEPSNIPRRRTSELQKNSKAGGGAPVLPGKVSKLRSFWNKVHGKDTPEESVASSSRSAHLNLGSSTPLPVRPVPASQDAPEDLNTVPDLCTRILGASISETKKNQCIGFLSGEDKDRYVVYKRKPPPNPNLEQQALTLSTIIIGNRRQQVLPKPDKWRVAGSLCLSVLLYHSTPWLQESLQSSDILFFGLDDNAQRRGHNISLKYPHLHAFRTLSPTTSTGQINDPDIKNRMLYYLGIILLELEFEDTFDSLLATSELSSTPSALLSNQRLSFLKRRAGAELGTLYGRIVRMCLDCDFGLGLDEYKLDDPRVQKVFFSQVVRPFQERMPEYEKIWGE